jgi:hypothetical protein
MLLPRLHAAARAAFLASWRALLAWISAPILAASRDLVLKTSHYTATIANSHGWNVFFR